MIAAWLCACARVNLPWAWLQHDCVCICTYPWLIIIAAWLCVYAPTRDWSWSQHNCVYIHLPVIDRDCNMIVYIYTYPWLIVIATWLCAHAHIPVTMIAAWLCVYIHLPVIDHDCSMIVCVYTPTRDWSWLQHDYVRMYTYPWPWSQSSTVCWGKPQSDVQPAKAGWRKTGQPV